MRGLNIIADSEDFLKLLRTVQTMTPYVYADSGTPLDALSPEEILAYEHFRAFAQEPADQAGGICIKNSSVSPYGVFIPGGLACNDNTEASADLFRRIGKHIRSAYHKTTIWSIYLSPEMYAAWKSGKKQFHFFVDARFIRVAGRDVPPQAKEYNLTLLGLVTRDIGDAYLVYRPGADIQTITTCKPVYLPESEAVFCWKQGKYWYIAADERHFAPGSLSSVPEVYNTLVGFI